MWLKPNLDLDSPLFKRVPINLPTPYYYNNEVLIGNSSSKDINKLISMRLNRGLSAQK